MTLAMVFPQGEASQGDSQCHSLLERLVPRTDSLMLKILSLIPLS